MLNVSHLSAGYGREIIVTDVSFHLPAGTITGLVGANGAGKSTLVKTITGLIQPVTCEDLTLAGQPLHKARGRLGYMPQHTNIDWQFPATVADVVRMGLLARSEVQHHWWPWRSRDSRKADRDAVHAALSETGMSDASRMPIGQLSGGQRQRTLLARTLVSHPSLIILDEPFAGVDSASQETIMGIIRARRDAGAAVLLVHHNLTEVARYCDDAVVLGQGRVLEQGPAQVVLTGPVIAQMFGIPA